MSSNSDALSFAIQKLAEREDLSADETEAALTVIMEGRASDVRKSALLMGLRAKGETPAEVAGGVRALRKAMIGVRAADPDRVVDTCGTGGGSLTTFNISTAAAFVVAGAGVPVAKHGNRSFSSRCGSADVLEALGVKIMMSPEGMGQLLTQVGLSFLYAPKLHPAMKHVGPIRKELAVPTIMNVLGPLTNPAGARRQVVGVSEPALIGLVAGAIAELGHIRGMVVHGWPGMDELSPLGTTEIMRVEEGKVDSTTFDPATELGWGDMDAGDLAGGEPRANARLVEEVISGRGPLTARAAVTLNAAAALYVAARADSLTDGVRLAETVIDEGRAREVLLRLREASREQD